jgi:hypothetical protein
MARVVTAERVESLVALLAGLPGHVLDAARAHFVRLAEPNEINPGTPDLYAALVRLTDAAATRRRAGGRGHFPAPRPGDLAGAVRRLDTVELRGQVLVMRRAADDLADSPAGAVFAELRELVEAEERRRDDAGWARVQRAERRARAECEALGIPWPKTLTASGG